MSCAGPHESLADVAARVPDTRFARVPALWGVHFLLRPLFALIQLEPRAESRGRGSRWKDKPMAGGLEAALDRASVPSLVEGPWSPSLFPVLLRSGPEIPAPAHSHFFGAQSVSRARLGTNSASKFVPRMPATQHCRRQRGRRWTAVHACMLRSQSFFILSRTSSYVVIMTRWRHVSLGQSRPTLGGPHSPSIHIHGQFGTSFNI